MSLVVFFYFIFITSTFVVAGGKKLNRINNSLSLLYVH